MGGHRRNILESDADASRLRKGLSLPSRRAPSRSAHSPAPMPRPSSALRSRRISMRRRALRAASTALTRPSRSAQRAAAHRPGSKETAAVMGLSTAHTTMERHHLRSRAAALSSAAAQCSRFTAVKSTSRRKVLMRLPTRRSQGAASRLRAARPAVWSADPLMQGLIGARQKLQHAGMLCVCRGGDSCECLRRSS